MSHVQLAYQIVTDRITKLLEEGTCPWQRPWNALAGMPRNLFSQRPYHGINVWMLGAQAYASPFWATAHQVKQVDGRVKDGEWKRYTPVVFYKVYEKEGPEGPEKRFVLNFFKLYNTAQLEGVAVPSFDTPLYEHTPLEHCEKLVGNYPNPPSITYGSSRAYYRPSTDAVVMPDMSSFENLSSYYSTLFHELTHSTGHTDRLNRSTLVDATTFGTVKYAKEELVAEMGAAYLCGVTGIVNETVNNSAAYLKGWLTCLRDDPKMLVQAAGQAQKAVDHILNQHPDVQGE